MHTVGRCPGPFYGSRWMGSNVKHCDGYRMLSKEISLLMKRVENGAESKLRISMDNIQVYGGKKDFNSQHKKHRARFMDLTMGEEPLIKPIVHQIQNSRSNDDVTIPQNAGALKECNDAPAINEVKPSRPRRKRCFYSSASPRIGPSRPLYLLFLALK